MNGFWPLEMGMLEVKVVWDGVTAVGEWSKGGCLHFLFFFFFFNLIRSKYFFFNF